MQITIDHAAAAPEAPAMIPPKMTCTTCYHPHTLLFWPCYFSFNTTFQQHAHHHLRAVAQLVPQTTTFSFTLHNEKQRASVDSLIFNMLFAPTQAPFWGFSGFPVFSAVVRVFLFDTGFPAA